ncbi:MAG: anthranilate phosphoribosyltransferase [Planctomycetota bacterium]
MIGSSIQRVVAKEDLTLDETLEVMDAVMRGRCSEEEMAQLLTALHQKGETVDEVAGAAAALRRHMTPIRSACEEVLDTCGTGGDGAGTFNISTAAALVIAAAGVPVAKHGNRRITSKSGSADVLSTLGVNIDAGVATVERCLNELGICFCFAPLMHPSMKNVIAVRRRLNMPTIFNLLGPLCNPAGAAYQLLGVGRGTLRDCLSAALLRLGTRRSTVVFGSDGLDEVTLGGESYISLVANGRVEQLTWRPSDFGLSEMSLKPLLVDGPKASAAMIREVLNGAKGAPRDMVVANAAAGLWTARKCADLQEGVARAVDAIDSGAARQLLSRLVTLSGTTGVARPNAQLNQP